MRGVDQCNTDAARITLSPRDLQREVERRGNNGDPFTHRLEIRANHTRPGKRAVPAEEHDAALIWTADEPRHGLERLRSVFWHRKTGARKLVRRGDGIVERGAQSGQPANRRTSPPLIPVVFHAPQRALGRQSEAGRHREEDRRRDGPLSLRTTDACRRDHRGHGSDDEWDQILYARSVKPLARRQQRSAGGDRPPRPSPRTPRRRA